MNANEHLFGLGKFGRFTREFVKSIFFQRNQSHTPVKINPCQKKLVTGTKCELQNLAHIASKLQYISYQNIFRHIKLFSKIFVEKIMKQIFEIQIIIFQANVCGWSIGNWGFCFHCLQKIN